MHSKMHSNPSYKALMQRVEELEDEVRKSRKTHEELTESEDKYRTLVEDSLQGVMILQNFLIVFANSAMARMTGYTVTELLNLSAEEIVELVHPEDRRIAWKRFKSWLEGRTSPHTHIKQALRATTKDGEIRWYEATGSIIRHKGEAAVMGAFVDITDVKRAEVMLSRRATELEEANTALRVFLRQKDQDRAEIEEKVLSNVQELIMPNVEKLKNSTLREDQKNCLDTIESNLRDIMSPLSYTLSSKYLNLTPSEIHIAKNIKQGRSTKEIAGFLNLSVNTIKFHRANIRKKLGIKNQKSNLRSYLIALEE